MNTCFVLDEFWPDPGGIATHYGMLVQQLVAGGHRVTILLYEQQHQEFYASFPGVEVVFLRQRADAQVPLARRMLSEGSVIAGSQLAFGMAAADWLQTEGRDIDVVETMDHKGFGACLLSESLPPLVVVCHGSLTRTIVHQHVALNEDRRLMCALEQVLFGLAEEVASPSPANAAEWSQLLGREVRFAVPPWQPLTKTNEPVGAEPTERGTGFGLVIGRLDSHKGALPAADALRRCLQRGAGVRLQWIGRSTRTAPGSRDMAEYLASEYSDIWGTSFKWLGEQQREETYRVLQASDYVVVPSTWDSFNYTAVEAMALGKPVVISEGAGAHYLCRDGEDGIRVPADDPQALSLALERMQSDPEMRKRMGRSSGGTIARELSPAKVVNARISMFEAAIRRRAARRKEWCSYAPFKVLLDNALAGQKLAAYREFEKLSTPQLLRKLLGKYRRKFARKLN